MSLPLVECGDSLRRVRQLLDSGEDVNRRTGPLGHSALTVRALWGQIKHVRMLLDRGADIEQATNKGCTP